MNLRALDSEVQQHLLEPALVHQHLGDGRQVLGPDQLHPGLAGVGGDDALHLVQEAPARLVGPSVDLHPPALDLGQVEDVVEQLQQVLARRVAVGQHLAHLLLVLVEPVHDQPGEAQDAGEGGAQLVAGEGQELAAEPVRLEQGGVGLLQFGGLGAQHVPLLAQVPEQPGVVDAHGHLALEDGEGVLVLLQDPAGLQADDGEAHEQQLVLEGHEVEVGLPRGRSGSSRPPCTAGLQPLVLEQHQGRVGEGVGGGQRSRLHTARGTP